MKEGVVHHPELFEAVVKGYNIDTNDFVINTANNVRAREGSYNDWEGLFLFASLQLNKQTNIINK